jgi:hypothetical protein
MSDCANCRRGCDYSGAGWFPPRAIVYCRPQVLWYLFNCESIREGKWMPEPDGSSYTDPALRSQSVRIPALNAEQLAAEIDARLRKCGIEGKLLEYEVRLEMELSPTSWKALNYISGWRRKTMSYTKWKSKSRPHMVGKMSLLASK